MSQALVTPYRTPSPECVSAYDWHDLRDQSRRRVEGSLPDWAPGTPVGLTRPIRVDVPRVLRECRLPATARLALVAIGVCSTTTLRLASRPFVLDRDYTATREVTLDLEIDGHELAGSLLVHTRLVTHERTERSPIAPWRPGLVLWEDSKKIRLEGSGARFPMEVRDFEKIGRGRWPSRAMWRLDWDPGALDEPVLGSIRLFLNSSHPMIRQMLDEPGGEASKVTRAMIRYEIGRLMVLAALDSPAFVEDPKQFGDDTVGQMLHRLVTAVGRDSVETIAARRRRDPIQFETDLQSALHVLGGLK